MCVDRLRDISRLFLHTYKRRVVVDLVFVICHPLTSLAKCKCRTKKNKNKKKREKREKKKRGEVKYGAVKYSGRSKIKNGKRAKEYGVRSNWVLTNRIES